MWRFLRSNSSPCQTLRKLRFRFVDDCPNASVLDHSNADVVALGAHCSLETGSDAVNSKAMLMLTLVFLHFALHLCGSPQGIASHLPRRRWMMAPSRNR
jgi:hypothetical protein